MNAPEKIPGLTSVREIPSDPLAGLHAPVLVDRVSDSIRLLIGLVAGFGACTPVDSIRTVLDGLGRADAHLVLSELSERHSRVRKDVELMYPELLGVLKDKCS